MMADKITIYIPTKNRLELLKRSVASVLGQTYDNWELIIVNDASTDGTKKYLDQLSLENSKIKVIHHTESKGACISRNEAIFSASGEFITGLDDDDMFTEDRLAKFLENWTENEVKALCAYKIIAANDKFSKDDNPQLRYITKDDLIYSNLIGNQVFTRTSVLQKIGGFDADFKMWQDYDCWYRLLKSGGQAKKIPVATYIWDHNDRTDRITNKLKDKLLETHSLFVSKHQLSSKQASIIKLNFLDYKADKLSFFYIIKMAFSTGFDKKAIDIMVKRKILDNKLFAGLIRTIKK
ncbi:MAG: hypothetical protein BGO86_05865 [Chryseobacterium sp. 36-9]|nr:glycosyltransferase [Epilithonimonas pallida]OJX30066.1 MAG: hypothetical protein BGO86_05865 [Chryseobacterium sp. 36-9]